MKLTATREELLAPLQSVIGVVERRQTMPVLANVLLSARDNRLAITGTDLEVELVERGGLAGFARVAAEIAKFAVGDQIDRLLHARKLRGPRRRAPAPRRTTGNMTSLRSFIAGALLAVLVPVAAWADDAAALRQKLVAGLSGVSSMRIVMTLAGSTATMVVRPTGTDHRTFAVHMQMHGPTLAMEMFIVDGFMYQSINGSRWERRPLPDPRSAVHLGPAFGDPGTVTPLPDRVEDGVTYGAFTESPPASVPSGLMTFTCTYEKSSGRLHSCESPLGTMTYGGYNDPGNLPAIPLFPPGTAPQPLGTP